MRLLLFVFIGLNIGCSPGINPESELMSTWEWVNSSGGFAGQTTSPSSTGDIKSIEFDRKRYSEYTNGILTEELNYSIALEESIFSTELRQVITFSNGRRQSYEIQGDTLFLSDECYDCFGHVYIRR